MRGLLLARDLVAVVEEGDGQLVSWLCVFLCAPACDGGRWEVLRREARDARDRRAAGPLAARKKRQDAVP